MSDGVGEVVGGEDRPGGGRYIHRQVGTYFLPVVEEGASQERQRERETERRGRSRRAVRRTCKEREREKAVTRIIPVRHPERMRVVHIR